MTTVQETVPMTVRADDVPGPPQGCWTYADYAALPEDGHRYEIIDGVLYRMPGASFAHQTAVALFTMHLVLHVHMAGLGRVIPAPFDVDPPLTPTVTVQPDVIVVLNANLGIITPGKISGTPDLVIEVASPGTAGQDRRKKQDAYARAGVPEYWIPDPHAKTIEVLALDGNAYRSLGVFEGGARLPSRVVPELPVAVEQFFA
jgi:Uma2 family endonuclease